MSVLLLDHTDFVIKQSPAGITVADGGGTIKAPFTEGKVTYMRSNQGGTLYIDDVEVGKHYTPCTGSSEVCSYYGTGTVRSIRFNVAAFP